MIRTLILGAAIATLTPAAIAQPVYVQRRAPAYVESYEAPYSPAYGRYAQVCQRWCPQDASPCDPVHFKVADGRCRPTLFYR